MKTLTAPRIDAASQAHLLIHTNGAIDQRRRPVDSPLTRLLALYSNGDEHARMPLRIEVHDLNGQKIFSAEDAESLVDVVLPEGAYHVITQLGATRRGYTMALKAGEAFDLYLGLTRAEK